MRRLSLHQIVLVQVDSRFDAGITFMRLINARISITGRGNQADRGLVESAVFSCTRLVSSWFVAGIKFVLSNMELMLIVARI